ncbi:MAG TPA: Gfo/Idh/MocA family oxidoreductase, partial [Bradyrhizobium sp.]
MPKTNRRDFLKQATVAGAGFWLAGRELRADDAASPTTTSPAENLNVGFIGVTNQGNYDLTEVSKVETVNVAALCDVDDKRLGEAAAKFPRARQYNDYRKMLDAGKDLDAIVVATPDHHHAFATMGSLQLNKHVYCEKPLTHTVRESRIVAETALRNKCVTQMGTQIHAQDNYRRAVEIVQAGVLGPVKEVHVWCSTRWSAGDVPKQTPPVPPNLHYDLWLGPAEDRPYSPDYLPANWRRWWAFGSGSLGDMGCHYQDLAFWA